MKDAYDKLKIISEILKNNWPILVLAFTALSSMATNASQYIANTDYEAEALASQQQIAEIANHYTKKEKRIYKMDCGICTTLMNDHKKEFH